MTYAVHPAAELFPLIEGEEFDKLVADIKANGLQNQIVLYRNQIIDGRNRLRACEAAGVTPTFREFVGTDPVQFIVSANIHRRHLSTAQRAAIAAELANLEHGSNQRVRKEEGSNDPSSGTSIEEAAAMMNVSPKSVKRAKKVMKDDPEAHKAAKQGRPKKGSKGTGRIGWTAAVEQEVGTLPGLSRNTMAQKRKPDIEQELGRPIPSFVLAGSSEAKEIAQAAQRVAARTNSAIAVDADSAADAARSELPKTAQQKLDRALKLQLQAEHIKLQRKFNEQLAAAIAADRAEIERAKHEAYRLEQAAKDEYEAANQYRLGVDSHMTQDEFKLVLSCLHPDKQPEEMRSRYDRAFQIFKRLEKTVNTKLPIAELRRRGWERVSPFSKKH